MTVIFLHSGWRTGSTYIWSRFRCLPETLAYYEPLHELLGASPNQLLSARPNPDVSHHPSLDAPYFAEYQPLIDDGRIKLFDPMVSYRRFFLSAGDQAPELGCYLAMLIDHARDGDRVPVLGFSRSLGRVGWLKDKFNAVHMLVLRDPRRQWASIINQKNRHGISYFLINQFLICGQNRDHPLLQPLIECYDIPLVYTSSVTNDMAIYKRLFDDVGDGIGYLVYYYLWRLTQALARPDCEIIVDLDRLCADSVYRTQSSTSIYDRTGLFPSFSDAGIGCPAVAQPDLDYQQIEDFVSERITRRLALPVIGARGGI